MITVNDIENALFEWAPKDLAIKGDFNGLVAGNRHTQVTHVLAALDVSQNTISEAAEIGAELIAAHHPIVWGEGAPWPNSDTDAGNILLTLCGAGIAAITMHTNLDSAQGGINDVLARLLGLENVGVFDKKEGIGRMGLLPKPMTVKEFSAHCKAVLKTCTVRFHDAGSHVQKIALCSGSGAFVFEDAVKAGCDAFVTGEAKHSVFLTAQNLGASLLECGHFATENVIVPTLGEFIKKRFPEIKVTLSRGTEEPYQCL
jgi:dinuclear metal center YbgI/SA1388 family protein